MAARKRTLDFSDDGEQTELRPGDVEIDLEEPEEEEEGGESEDDDGPPEPTRREKKRSRWREHKQRAEEAERRAQEAEARYQAAVEQRRQEMEWMQRQPPQQQAPQQQPQATPHQEKLESIRREQELLLKEWQGISATATPEQAQEYRKKAWDLDHKKHEAMTEAVLAARQQPIDPQQRAQMEHAQNVRAWLQVNYSDVVQNPQAGTWAVGRWHQLRAEGQADTKELVERVMKETRQRFGLGGEQRPAPTQQRRQQFSGVGKGASAPPSEAPKKVTLTRDQQRMATTMYPDVPEKKAYEMWAKRRQQRRAKSA